MSKDENYYQPHLKPMTSESLLISISGTFPALVGNALEFLISNYKEAVGTYRRKFGYTIHDDPNAYVQRIIQLLGVAADLDNNQLEAIAEIAVGQRSPQVIVWDKFPALVREMAKSEESRKHVTELLTSLLTEIALREGENRE